MRPTLRKALSAAVIAVIFFFLIRDFVRNWQSIPFSEIRFQPLPIFLSYGLLFMTFVIFVTAWQAVLRGLGEQLGFRRSFWIMAASQMGKYMPGKIWFFVGRVIMAKQEQLKGVTVGLSVFVETVLTLIWGAVLMLVSLGFSRAQSPMPLWMLVIIIVPGLALLHPAVLGFLAGVIMRIFKREQVVIPLSFGRMLFLSLYYLSLWLTQIFGFYLLMNSFYRVPAVHLPRLVFVYTSSWILGFIAPFAPGGLGVREGIMSLGLATILPPGLAIGISFLSRIWLTVFEIVVFGIGLLFRSKRRA